MEHLYSFEKLRVWHDARAFIKKIYLISKAFPKEEQFGLISQIRRAAVSVASNIAEGSSRTTTKDRAHFTQIAYGSLLEILSHLYVAVDLEYIKKIQLQDAKKDIISLTKQLSSLRKSQLNP
jgi:four helix bundle protein